MPSNPEQETGIQHTTGMGFQPDIGVWCKRDPRSSPLGLSALVLSIAGSTGYIAGVARPLGNSTLDVVLDSGLHNAEILTAIVGSGMAILLSLFSLALEKALLPALFALFLLLIVENSLFPIWTLMLGRWGLGLVYGLALIVAFVLLMTRLILLCC